MRPLDLERHEQAKAWASEQVERQAGPCAVRSNTGEQHFGCLIITVEDGASLYRRLEGTWNGVVASAGAGLL